MDPKLENAPAPTATRMPGAPLDAGALAARDAAEYIEAMCAEMLLIADRAGLGFLGYLLDVAREEAMLHINMPAPTEPRAPADPMAVYGEVPPSRA